MSLFLRYAFPFFLASLLLGCSDKSPQGKVHMPKPTKLQGVIPEHQLQALEKAKGIDGMLQKSEESRRQSIENNNR